LSEAIEENLSKLSTEFCNLNSEKSRLT